MQLFVRTSGGTLAVECAADDTVGSLKERLCAQSAHLGPCRFLRLQYGGLSLPDERPLSQVGGIAPSATLQLNSRLRGGGGDGGSTGAESRSCYLEMYLGRKADKVNPEEERLARWTRCHLSGEPLAPPVVADDLGNLYNKDALIQRLLDKSLPPALSHITGLRSVTQLELQRAERGGSAGAGGSSARASSQVAFQPNNDSDFCCPVAGVAMNGRYKFVFVRPGGLVVSEKALKEVPAVVEELAGKKVAELDTTPINPTGEQLEELRARVAAKLAEKATSKKESKKRAAVAAATQSGPGAAAAGAGASGSAPAAQRGGSPQPEDAAGAAAAAAKRLKVPTGASKEVYASIFMKPSGAPEKETFCCRALSARGMNLT